MVQLNRIVGIILVLIFGFGVQLIFSMADAIDTPNKAAVEFSKAYFKLDKSMAKRICTEQLASEDANVVDNFLNMADKTARDRGFDISFLKNKLYHIETETISKNDTEAQIRITGKRRVAINPVYSIVASLFHIGSTHKVDEVIHVIKEKGKWKVCGKPFSLTQPRTSHFL